MNSKWAFGWIYVLLVFCGCAGAGSDQEKTAFVTMLGNDTLAVESFEKTSRGMDVKVLLRSPQTQLTSYRLTEDESGGIASMTALRYEQEMGFKGNGTFHHSVSREGDSLMVDMMTPSGDRRTFTVEYRDGTLPFIDMVHWPFELALKRAVEKDADSLMQPLLSGNRTSMFTLARIEEDSMTIRHPYRGVMGVRLNEQGGLDFLNAGLTTRKLKVYRTSDIDIDKLAMRFIEHDKDGSPFGSLSSAETGEFEVNGVQYRVEYGSPKRRGRDLFGGIVPWGERWRTGANRATHFYTSNDIRIGELRVPAGEYTLFTIPEPEGGTLIINKQTGQNGRSYDESRDLGRIPMLIRSRENSMEDFTINVADTGSDAELQLIWGNTEFYVSIKD